MNEKYYVVSESELQNLRSCAFAEGAEETEHDDTQAAHDTCRARPVPQVAKDYIESVWGYYED